MVLGYLDGGYSPATCSGSVRRAEILVDLRGEQGRLGVGGLFSAAGIGLEAGGFSNAGGCKNAGMLNAAGYHHTHLHAIDSSFVSATGVSATTTSVSATTRVFRIIVWIVCIVIIISFIVIIVRLFEEAGCIRVFRGSGKFFWRSR